MKLSCASFLLVLLVFEFSCQQSATMDKEKMKNEILAVVDGQVRYWNEGNIEKYMAGTIDLIRYDLPQVGMFRMDGKQHENDTKAATRIESQWDC